jgi:hypothetical protein
MCSARITYSQRHDAKPEQERNVLAAVYKLCLETSHARERGRLPDECGLDDVKGRSKSDFHASDYSTR